MYTTAFKISYSEHDLLVYYCIATFLFQETQLWQQWTVQKEYSNDHNVLNCVTYSLKQIITWGASIPGRALANIVELLYIYYSIQHRMYTILQYILCWNALGVTHKDPLNNSDQT